MKNIPLLILLLLSYSLLGQENLQVEKYFDGLVINDITGDGESVWIATEGNGILKFDKRRETFSNYSTAKGNIQHDFFYCIAANDRFVWAGSIDGLFMLDKRRDMWSKRKFGKGGQLSNWIRSLAYDEFEDALWIGRFMYLSKLDLKKRRFIDYDLTINKDEKTNTIKSIAVDDEKFVWFGTEGGLHKYDKRRNLNDEGAVQFYDNRLNYFNGEGDAVSVNALLIEQENVWIGLDEFITRDRPNYNLGGLYKFDKKNIWIKFDERKGFNANGIFDLERTGNYIWVSLYQFGQDSKSEYGRGVAIINRITEEFQAINHPDIPDKILSMYFDGENMWLGSDQGLIKINLTNELAYYNEENLR
ncbi:MAG: hypothetical protein K9J16_07245 [Melioribacteraceae bacterium]|nr:hypothetical protein [Melioribacteraceae bacterium]MCF8354940.1 hypothetical protein [Melioribacteraceae bacterium]MCF8392371.1 hypothetical protein [Melioribacteraceae bacterium]MCF8417891.1 hypothetical protein [Melioribacteraceae bacterium]